MRKRSIRGNVYASFLVLLNVNHSDIKAFRAPHQYLLFIIDTSDRVSSRDILIREKGH